MDYGAIAAAVGGIVQGGLGARKAQQNFDRSQKQERVLAQQNIDLQREFAQNGIQWKVSDARAAGIHPLYALGANTTSFQNVVGGGSTASNVVPNYAGIGQNIGRAINSVLNSEERQLSLDLQREQLKSSKLDNDIKRAEFASHISRMNSAQLSAPLPSVENTNFVPAQVTASPSRHRMDIQAGPVPSVMFRRRSDGGMIPIPSKESKEGMEDMFMMSPLWFAEHYLKPLFSSKGISKPSVSDLPAGKNAWRWNGYYFKPVYVPNKLPPKGYVRRKDGTFKRDIMPMKKSH